MGLPHDEFIMACHSLYADSRLFAQILYTKNSPHYPRRTYSVPRYFLLLDHYISIRFECHDAEEYVVAFVSRAVDMNVTSLRRTRVLKQLDAANTVTT